MKPCRDKRAWTRDSDIGVNRPRYGSRLLMRNVYNFFTKNPYKNIHKQI